MRTSHLYRIALLPSCDFSSHLPLMNKRDGSVQQLIAKMEISGQMNLILCKNTLRLRLLKAFVASIWSTAVELSLSNKSTMLGIADSTPATWPAQSCYGPAACTTSFFTTDIIGLPMILRNTSPIPVGLTPGGLFSRVNWLARSASKLSWQLSFWEHDFFVILASDLCSSRLWLQNTFEPRSLRQSSASNVKRQPSIRQSSASNYDGPAASFFLTLVFFIKHSLISSNTISCISFFWTI